MLTDMKLIPHRHFGMPGKIQSHMLVYTVCIAIVLTVFFDLGRIASLGAMLYLVMDIIVHWGVLRYLREEINANRYIVLLETDVLIVTVAGAIIVFIYITEQIFLKQSDETIHPDHSQHQ